MLRLIAADTQKQLTSKESMMSLEMTSSSIMSALDGLMEKDILEQQETEYQIMNPIIKYYVISAISR